MKRLLPLLMLLTACQPSPTSTPFQAAVTIVPPTVVAEITPTLPPTTDTSPTISDTPTAPALAPTSPFQPGLQEYDVPTGSHPHDVAPAPDGTVWYTAQLQGALGR